MAVDATWGGSTLPALDAERGIAVTPERIGNLRRALDGTARTDLLAEKVTLSLQWVGLTSAEYTSLKAIYAAKSTAANTLVLPDSRSWSVVVAGPLQDSVTWEGGVTARYDVTLDLVEA